MPVGKVHGASVVPRALATAHVARSKIQTPQMMKDERLVFEQWGRNAQTFFEKLSQDLPSRQQSYPLNPLHQKQLPLQQQQQQQQQQIHTIFINPTVTSKLHTAPPSTPFVPFNPHIPAPRTPSIARELRSNLKQALGSASAPAASHVIRIPGVTRQRSAALSDPLLNRLLVLLLGFAL
jgi:hypothetical protein